MVSPLDQNSIEAEGPAEPCPTPLSTPEVFESFEREGDSWEVSTPAGKVRGWTLGEGPALYFLNGLEGTSELFRLVAWLLREEFRSVLFDAGVDSPLPPKKVNDVSSLPEVRQLFAVADRHGDDSFLAYGSGFGSWVLLAGLLADEPRFRGAILQAGYAERRFKLLERLLLLLAERSNRRWKDVPGWKAVFEQNHRRWFPPFDAPRWELFEQIAGNVPVSQVALCARQIRQVRFAPRLAEIARPVLLLQSEGEGRVLRQRQQEMQRLLPDVREEFLKDTGLVPHWTHPHRIAKIIRQFAGSLHEIGQPVSGSV